MRRYEVRLGMTLLEVILAMSLAGGVLASVMTFYHQAVEVRRTVEREVRLVESQRMIMNRITNDLRSATTYPFLGMGMEGAVDSLRFICSTVPGRAAWAVRQSTEDPIPPEQDLQIVGYALRETDDGEVEGMTYEGLERTRQKVLTVEQVEEGDEVEAVLLSEETRFIAFRYWRDGIWLESWGGGDLPLAVEVIMGRHALPENTEPADYPFETCRRVVYLPGAAPPAQGRRVRGLTEGGGA